MKRALSLVIFILLIFICAVRNAQGAKRMTSQNTVQGFTVRLTYSNKAKHTLIDRKETVIVLIYHGEDLGPDDNSLGSDQKEITPGQDAVFSWLHLKKSKANQASINVFSGRKSSKDNLLDCSFYQGPLKDVQGKIVNIACKLITESSPSEVPGAAISP